MLRMYPPCPSPNIFQGLEQCQKALLETWWFQVGKAAILKGPGIIPFTGNTKGLRASPETLIMPRVWSKGWGTQSLGTGRLTRGEGPLSLVPGVLESGCLGGRGCWPFGRDWGPACPLHSSPCPLLVPTPRDWSEPCPHPTLRLLTIFFRGLIKRTSQSYRLCLNFCSLILQLEKVNTPI